MSRNEQNRFLATFRGLAVAVTVLCGAVVARAEVLQPSADAGANTDAIQAAIDAASAAGGTVELAEGVFTITNCIEVKAGVTLKGAGREKTILKQTVTYKSCLKVDAATASLSAAAVEKLTVTGVYSYSGNSGNSPGVWMEGGRMSYCIVSNNASANLYAYYGAGIHIAGGGVKIDHTIIRKNYQNFRGNGGGVAVASKITAMPVFDTCLIADNGGSDKTQGAGAGIYCASPIVLLNCTIAGNVTTYTESNRKDGGGVYFGAKSYVTNCIFSGNQAVHGSMDGNPNWAGTAPDGSHNFFGDGSTTFGDNPQSATTASFRSAANGDYTLTAISAAKEKGLWYAGIPVDLLDAERPSPVDIGCYRYDASKEPFSCPSKMSVTEAFVDQKVSFETQLVNPPSGGSFTYVWTLTDQFGNERTLADSATPCEAIPSAGFYTVSLEVRDKNSTSKANDTIAETLHIAVRTNYVTSVTTAVEEYPYDTPGKAAKCLNTVVAETIDGSTIILDGGTHKLSATAEIGYGVHVVGAGAEATLVDAQAKRAFYIHNRDALLEDLSITGGSIGGNSTAGSAVGIDGTGGTVRRCRMFGNGSRQQNGSGDVLYLASSGALVENCIITNNQGTTIGGGDSSIIEVGSGILRNCLIARNTCNYKDKLIIECAVVGVGGGGIVQNCTIVSNVLIGTTAQSVALQMSANATVCNVIVADNVATNGTAEATTYVSAPHWSKVKPKDGQTLAMPSHCAVGNGGAAIGTDDADGSQIRFVDAANGNWRLARGSSCYGRGVNEDWMKASVDLDGKPRILGRRVDIGCYEADPNGLMVLVR